MARIEDLRRRTEEAAAALSTAERRARDAAAATAAAERDLSVARAHGRNDGFTRTTADDQHEEEARQALNRAKSEEAQAASAYAQADEAWRSASRAYEAAAVDPKLAKACVERARKRLAEAERTATKSAQLAAEAATVASKAEGVVSTKAAAARAAREAFDADPSKRAAYLKTRVALDDVKVDAARAQRLASDAASLAASDAAAKEQARRELALAETSRGMVAVRIAPLIERLGHAYAELLSVHIARRELAAELNGVREAAGDDALAPVELPRFSDMRREALADLRRELTSRPGGLTDQETSALVWLEHGAR